MELMPARVCRLLSECRRALLRVGSVCWVRLEISMCPTSIVAWRLALAHLSGVDPGKSAPGVAAWLSSALEMKRCRITGVQVKFNFDEDRSQQSSRKSVIFTLGYGMFC